MIMRRYTPFALASSTGAAPPGSVSPLPGTFSVHSGAFSLASRLADAYSARTFFQSHWSSSATIIGFAVNTPVPSSVWPTRIVTVSSGAIVIQALISGTVASRYHGVGATGIFAASALGGIQKPRTIAPPTAAVVVRNSRRSMSVLFSGVFSLMMSSLYLTTQRGSAVDGLADAVISSAAAGVGHLSIDVGVRWLRFFLEQRHRSQNLPGLTVAALRNVKLLPRELHRMRPIGRQSLDSADLPAHSPDGLHKTGPHRVAIHQDGAGAALADAAAIFRTGETNRIAEHPQQRCLRFRVHRILNAIDEKGKRHIGTSLTWKLERILRQKRTNHKRHK